MPSLQTLAGNQCYFSYGFSIIVVVNVIRFDFFSVTVIISQLHLQFLDFSFFSVTVTIIYLFI